MWAGPRITDIKCDGRILTRNDLTHVLEYFCGCLIDNLVERKQGDRAESYYSNPP